jgi:hypothetical protein
LHADPLIRYPSATPKDPTSHFPGRHRPRWPGADRLRGGSWLYHLTSYRSLFPPEMLATARAVPIEDELTFLALWGQFVHADGTLRAATVGPFENAITQARDRKDLLAAFPLAKLAVDGTPRLALDWLKDAGRAADG